MPRAPPNLFRSCARQQPASTDSCTPPNHRFRMAGSPFAQGRAADHGPRYATCGGRTGSKVSQIAVTDQLLLMPNGKGMSVGKHIKPVRDIGDLPVKVVGEQDPFRVFFFVDQSFERGHMPRSEPRERRVQQHGSAGSGNIPASAAPRPTYCRPSCRTASRRAETTQAVRPAEVRNPGAPARRSAPREQNSAAADSVLLVPRTVRAIPRRYAWSGNPHAGSRSVSSSGSSCRCRSARAGP